MKTLKKGEISFLDLTTRSAPGQLRGPKREITPTRPTHPMITHTHTHTCNSPTHTCTQQRDSRVGPLPTSAWSVYIATLILITTGILLSYWLYRLQGHISPNIIFILFSLYLYLIIPSVIPAYVVFGPITCFFSSRRFCSSYSLSVSQAPTKVHITYP